MKCLSLIICFNRTVCPPLPDDWVSSFVEEIVFLPREIGFSPSEKNIAKRAWKTRPTIKMCTGKASKKHSYMNRLQKYFYEIPALSNVLQAIPVKIFFLMPCPCLSCSWTGFPCTFSNVEEFSQGRVCLVPEKGDAR